MLKMFKKPAVEINKNEEINQIVENKVDFSQLESLLNRQDIDLNNLPKELLHIAQIAKQRFSQSDKNALISAVDSSVNASNIQASIARAYLEVVTSESEISMMAAAIEELTASISQISNLAKNTDDSLEASVSSATKGASEVEEAANSSKSVNSALGLVDQDLNNLNAAAIDIRGMLQEIESIASQTNLLALNATIEAARAGEAGKGFAVVAQEVKSLSSQTAKSTEDIKLRIVRLENAISEITKAVETAKTAALEAQEAAAKASQSVAISTSEVQHGADGVANVAQVLGEQSQAVQELSEGVLRASNSAKNAKNLIDESVGVVVETEKTITEQLDNLEKIGVENYVLYRAKSDHILWKKRLASLICGFTSLSESELSDHNSCRLGKWWNLAKSQNPNNSASFLAIETPHRLVHEFGKEAARLYNSGDRQGALNAYFKMDDASKEVVRMLDMLIKETEK